MIAASLFLFAARLGAEDNKPGLFAPGGFYNKFKNNDDLGPEDLSVLSNEAGAYLMANRDWKKLGVTGFSRQLDGRFYLFAIDQKERTGFRSRALVVDARSMLRGPGGSVRWSKLFLPYLEGFDGIVSRDYHSRLVWNDSLQAVQTTFCYDILGHSSVACHRSTHKISIDENRLLKVELLMNNQNGADGLWKTVWEKGKWIDAVRSKVFNR